MLTVGINAPATAGATESTVFGPFFVDDAPEIPLGGDLARGAKRTPCWVSGQVRSTDGPPLTGVRVDSWEADENGLYDTQVEGSGYGRGWQRTGVNGEYRFWSVLPVNYPAPDDGPVGEVMVAAGRASMRPAQLHFMVTAPGYYTLITHVFAAGDPYLDNDAVFGVKDSLIRKFTVHDGVPLRTALSGRATGRASSSTCCSRPNSKTRLTGKRA